MSNNIVVIPVYKTDINKYEKKSFRQCCKVLGTHDICLVTYPELNCDCYYSIAKSHGVGLMRENFDKEFFSGIDGYNKLMLSMQFYERFLNYQYLLICQLDAYVFRDELDSWSDKGFDYIGAPIFDNVLDLIRKQYNDYFGEPLHLKNAYNGGASLRNVGKFVSALSENKSFVSKLSTYGFYEDIIFSILFSNQKCDSENEALGFSFESFPSDCYILNGRNLPMMCHGWSRNDVDGYDSDFWLRKIMPFEYWYNRVRMTSKILKHNMRKIVKTIPKSKMKSE